MMKFQVTVSLSGVFLFRTDWMDLKQYKVVRLHLLGAFKDSEGYSLETSYRDECFRTMPTARYEG